MNRSIFRHELKCNLIYTIIWTAALVFSTGANIAGNASSLEDGARLGLQAPVGVEGGRVATPGDERQLQRRRLRHRADGHRPHEVLERLLGQRRGREQEGSQTEERRETPRRALHLLFLSSSPAKGDRIRDFARKARGTRRAG